MRTTPAHIIAAAKSTDLGHLRRNAPRTLVKGVKAYPETLVIH